MMKTENALNGICPYFTMFPLEFPYSILKRYAKAGQWVLDPFCGRGTTNYAGRILGLPSIGVDSNPVAVAVSEAKLANTTPQRIIRTAENIFDKMKGSPDIPTGEFWELAFHRDVLKTLCHLREEFLKNCRSDSRKALRAIVLGALHGPRGKSRQSYFSNQAQRTYAPKPGYAVKYWKSWDLVPERVDVLDIIKNRAIRYYSHEVQKGVGKIIQGDSRKADLYSRMPQKSKFSWIITSPPYYGMRTYIPDQWLRLWFLGGRPSVDYSNEEQLAHSNPQYFAAQLQEVWQNAGRMCDQNANLIIRFGGINDRKVEPLPILEESFKDTGWQIQEIQPAGSASSGRRQALHISNTIKQAREEYDVWALWGG